jgi:hypothetical protein
MTVVNNVFFAYTKIMNPVPAINKDNSEVSVVVIMDEDTSDDWNEKNEGHLTKSLKNEAFTEKYKIDPPFPNQKKQYVVNVKKMHSKGGVELPEKFRPRVFQVIEGKNVDITFEKEVGNGSYGKLSYSTYTNNFGTHVQLDSILVEKLVEYTREEKDGVDGEGGNNRAAGSDFGNVELAEAPKGQKAVNKQSDVAPKSRAKPAPDFSDMDDDIPFMRGCKLGLQDPFFGKYAHYL